MKIIISPAKKMEECPDLFGTGGMPEYLDRTEILCERLKSMSEAELQAVFKANDQITRQNFERYRHMELARANTPALLAYVGIQYQYMAPKLFSEKQWEYVKEHLRILSGFYGILRPDDAVTPYRLEMQAKLSVEGTKDLYDFWGSSLYASLTGEAHPVIINLASKEYSVCVSKHLPPQARMITCVFGEEKDGKIVEKGTLCKMARGEMVRYMAENRIDSPEQLRRFDRLDYQYQERHSDERTYVYVLRRRGGAAPNADRR